MASWAWPINILGLWTNVMLRSCSAKFDVSRMIQPNRRKRQAMYHRCTSLKSMFKERNDTCENSYATWRHVILVERRNGTNRDIYLTGVNWVSYGIYSTRIGCNPSYATWIVRIRSSKEYVNHQRMKCGLSSCQAWFGRYGRIVRYSSSVLFWAVFYHELTVTQRDRKR
jgi:hypothetical protein